MAKQRILQLNLDGTGGAFSLMYQLQLYLKDEFIFDFYWMGKFVHSEKSDDLEKNGSKIYEEDLRKNRLLGHILLPWKFYRFLKSHPYDIVHINADLAYKLLLYAYPAYKAGVKKIIIHSHSSGVNGDHKSLKLAMHKMCKPFLKTYANTFLTCSKLASKWMYDDQNYAIMINNGVELEKFKFSLDVRNKIRKDLNLTDQILIGTVGNLSFQKYPEFFVDILKRLPKDKYKGIFVGDGPDREAIEKYVADNGVIDQIIFLGNTNHVENVLCAMDIFAMPSRFEGLPVSAIEAQASGLSCFISNKITSEVKLLNTCELLPIDDPDVWAQAILQTNINVRKRTDATEVLKKKGFDIRDSALELRKIYQSERS